MRTNRFEPKFEALVSRYRGRDAHPAAEEIENLYTEGCAELLRLEAELLRLKRRARAARADSAHDARAAQEAGELQRRLDGVNDEVAAVRKLVRLLRTGVDWTQTQERAQTG
jgi:flagellar motility protein MotE (MotC chaperone)